jgi:hypothetical protein
MKKILLTACLTLIIISVYLAITNKKINFGTIDATLDNNNESNGIIVESFHEPRVNNSLYIQNAETEHINIPNCDKKSCDIEIIKYIKGVSDQDILKINNTLTRGIFEDDSDIRDPNQRTFNTNVSVDFFSNKIEYIDKGIVGYSYSFNLGITNSARPSIESGYSVLDVKNLSAYFYNNHVILFDESSDRFGTKVLQHFYPNGRELIAEFNKKFNVDNVASLDCIISPDSFPEEFTSTLVPNTNEVVFYVTYPSAIKVCQYEATDLKIAISVKDILNEVPELIPKSSLLWRFKDVK